MASFGRTEYIDSLTVNNIFTRGNNNNSNIPAFRVLTTDGAGGTMWMTLSSLQYGAGYHTIRTSVGSYTADQATNATFSLLDGPNAGLINDPTASNTAYLYAKAFGQFDISGGNSIIAFDPVTNQVNSNILFVGTGGINIKGDPQTNTMYFDGRQLPFISTLPYSFNQMLVFSNAPLNTLVASTLNKSLIMQAQGPSSILSFVGEDIIVIDTNYANNQIKFKLSTLTLPLISSIIGNVNTVVSTYVTKVDLSTLSTSYKTILPFDDFQKYLSTMGSTINSNIYNYSTSVGDLGVYSRGISTVWRQFQINTFNLGYSSASQLVSTSGSLQAEINVLSNQVFRGYNNVIASSIQTPYFAVSTNVELTSTIFSSISTPIDSINPINIVYYPTYSSFYNAFNDSQPFGSPTGPIIYPTSFDITSGTNTMSTMSTTSGIIFSSMYAVKGTFVFYPNNDPQQIQLEWVGNLSLNINGSNYASSNLAYPRLTEFSNTTITASIANSPISIVNFTYSKINASDYLKFTNFTDYLAGTVIESYSLAPIYSAYGYNTNDTPLYQQSLSSFPIGFSSFSNLDIAPYLELSSYVMIASTFYTSGCNTTFPISSSGFNSISFLESTTQIQKYAYIQDLTYGTTSSIFGQYSASNVFGYGYTYNIPSTPYTLQMVYGRQNNNETLLISSIYREIFNYKFTPAVYISSILYLGLISSYTGEFVNFNARYLNIENLTVSTMYVSSISSSYGEFNVVNTSNVSSVNANIGNISATTAAVSALFVSSINNIQLYEIDSSTISTIYTNLTILTATISTSVTAYSTSLIYTNSDSTLSTMNAGIEELLSSISSSLDYYSSSLIQYGTSCDSTISSIYIGLLEITSTILTDTELFSTSLVNVSPTSTISSIVGEIDILSTSLVDYTSGSNASTVSTLVYQVNALPLEVHTSTLFTSSIQLAGSTQPFIQYGLSDSIITLASSSPLYPGLGAGYYYTSTILSTPYINTSYTVNLTYNGAANLTLPLQANITSRSTFDIIGPNLTSAFWTTYGSIF